MLLSTLLLRKTWVSMSIKSFVQHRIGIFTKNCGGLTLIEASIGLIILGLLAVPLIQIYKVEIAARGFSRTSGALQEVTNAINLYFNSDNNAYPCPANLGLAQGDADFGQAGDCTLANVPLCTSAGWFTNEGICKTEDSANAVIIGGVPFSTLLLPEDETLDFWGNKILYAVSFNQTDALTFANPSTISVMTVDDPKDVAAGTEDGTPDPLPSEYSFFLASTGASGVGGYTRAGIPIAPCGSALTGYDHENCDFDDTFFFGKNPNNLAESAYSEAPGSTFFDDFTVGQIGSPPLSTWYEYEDNATIADRDYASTTATSIGIGVNNTDPAHTLDVAGDVRVENSASGNGWLKSDDICDSTVSNCFDPELITGTENTMHCNSADIYYGTQGVMGLSNGRVNCGSTLNNTNGSPIDDNGLELRVDTSVISNLTCSGAQIVAGIDANGDIICVTP